MPAPDGAHDAHDPWLAEVPGVPLVVLTQRTVLESPGPIADSIAAVRVKPWDAWPPIFDAPGDIAHGAQPGVPFVVGVNPLTSTLSLFFARFPTPSAPCDGAALFGVDPLGFPSPAAFLVPLPGACHDTPLFTTTSTGGAHLVAAGGPSFDHPLHTTLLSAGGTPSALDIPGCAKTPLVGDAVPRGSGFLFVHAAGAPEGCSLSAGVGKILRVVDFQQDAGGTVILGVPVVEGADDMVQAHLLAAPSGGYRVVWRESGASAEIQPPAMAGSISLATFTVGAPFAVTDAGVDRVAVAGFGEGLAAAFTTALDDGGSRLTLRVFGAVDGVALAERSIDVPGAIVGRLSVIASPADGKSVLVTWTEAGSLPRVVKVARFDCGG